jgi:hypothetical protein
MQKATNTSNPTKHYGNIRRLIKSWELVLDKPTNTPRDLLVLRETVSNQLDYVNTTFLPLVLEIGTPEIMKFIQFTVPKLITLLTYKWSELDEVWSKRKDSWEARCNTYKQMSREIYKEYLLNV